MKRDQDFLNFLQQTKLLDTENRPVRMRMEHAAGILTDVLLPQRVMGTAAICEGTRFEVWCISTDAGIELKQLIGLPVAVDFVTDRGELNTVSGIVTEACAGDSDGGVATYKLVMRDALAILDKRVNTRIFRNLNEFEIVKRLIAEWRQSNEVLANAFDMEVDESFQLRQYPQREFTMQYNESDAAFIRRLLARCGIAWYIRAGAGRESGAQAEPGKTLAHTLVLFNNADSLPQNRAGTVRYHRDNATEQRDTITSWAAVRTLQAGSVTLHSWDYKQPQGYFSSTDANSAGEQGPSGDELAASLNDYQILPPHTADDHDELRQLGRLRMQRHDYEAKCYRGQGSVRDFCVGEYFSLADHPEIDTHPAEERDFVITGLQLTAQNNLPKGLVAKVERLFSRNRWTHAPNDHSQLANCGPVRFHMTFSAVRRGVPIVPAFDARVDLPNVPLQSAIVVGPPGEEVYCDKFGRARIRFLGLRPDDHAHAQGAGTSGTERDSAWVRVASSWAGNGPGSLQQCGSLHLPRVGTEVLVAFMGGDPDKPVIVGQLYNGNAQPAALSEQGDLPGNRYLSGIKSREIKGERHNQLRFDDSTGRINAQLSSDHGASQLNLGWLTHPIAGGSGDARGEGADLRSDKAVAVRGAQGVLITADARPGAKGRQLDRPELIGINDVLQGIHKTLSELAVKHFADDGDGAPLAKLIEHIRQWEKGSNTEGGTPDPTGGKPIVAVSAPAGIALASQDNVMIGAQTNTDLVSAGNTQVSAGRKLLMRAAQGVSLFAHKVGMQLIAASGKVVIQGQDDMVEIGAAKRLHLYSLESLLLEAPEVVIRTDGAQWSIGKGKVMSSSSGEFNMQASEFKFTRGGGGSLNLPSMPHSTLETDEQIAFSGRGGQARENVPYEVSDDQGAVQDSGKSGADGASKTVVTDNVIKTLKVRIRS
ncbi:type VI secretion system tip protein VgrG [Duganella sp. FT3S]|uniref:Type VI secretion system tip protein VgrG n=1 Tax=Rugamonas fusca TaxID=2758568 RepID=A0A7W2EJE9_9BURK|nr:type VI secretion system Vgr family protein [Rugamonas fusca]MBA5607050.1 type VI secretion system tip protein VgrG [Rugamonas fusca]